MAVRPLKKPELLARMIGGKFETSYVQSINVVSTFARALHSGPILLKKGQKILADGNFAKGNNTQGFSKGLNKD